MPVSFPTLLPNTLVPLFYAEVTSAPQPIVSNLRMLLIGHMNNGEQHGEGTAVANTPYILTGPEASTLFGPGSQLAWMYAAARANAEPAEIWGIAITERPPGPTVIRATGEIVVTAPGSRNRTGVVGFYIAGRVCKIFVEPTDTQHQIAEKIRKAINGAGHPIRALAVPADPNPKSNIVKVECTWYGYTGNEIRITHTGPRAHVEKTSPNARLSRSLLTLPGSLSGGEGETEAEDIFATVEDMPFDLFVVPDQSPSLMGGVRDFMVRRWSPYNQLYGHTVSAKIDDLPGQEAFAETHNDPHHSVLAIQQSVCPPWEWASALAGVMVTHWAAPPELSRPLQTLPMYGLFIGSEDSDSFTRNERQTLLDIGMSTFGVDPDGTPRIDRVRTLRQHNEFDPPDREVSWADAITMFQTMFFVRSMKAHIQNTFPRCALTDVPTGINGFVSVDQIRIAIMHNYRLLEGAGLVENSALFSRYLVVERNTFDPNRVDVLMRPDMVNQLRVVAALVETHLQIDPGALEAVAA